MTLLRQILRWLAWGALGPLLLLISDIPLERSWYLYQSYPSAFTRPGVVAEALVGLVLVVAGILFVFRALNWLLAPVVVAAAGALDIAADIALYGALPDELQLVLSWALMVVATGFYAYHCHVPGYTLSVLSSGRFASTADHRRPGTAPARTENPS